MENKNAKAYLEFMVGKIHKIVPLYEYNQRLAQSSEDNGYDGGKNLSTYVESLIFELEGFGKRIADNSIPEYESIINILTSIKDEVLNIDSKTVVKRESFKCIDIIHKISSKIDGDNNES